MKQVNASSKIIRATLNRFCQPYRIILLFVLVIGTGCKRDAPTQGTAAVPQGTATILPIAEFSLGPNISEPSGIAYNAKNNSFIVVSDSHPEVYEIDSHGTLLRTIPTAGSDLEGIALSITNDTIYVVEEKNRLVVSFLANGTKLSSFSADVASLPNNALEGITAGKNGHLYVLNEKLPGMLLEYALNGTELKRTPLSIASDYADIFYSESEDCLWMISDESQKIMKTDLNGSLISQWYVPFTKGEGITIVRDTIYVVNDSDAKLYIFNKPK